MRKHECNGEVGFMYDNYNNKVILYDSAKLINMLCCNLKIVEIPLWTLD